jgi:hypothetical protein
LFGFEASNEMEVVVVVTSLSSDVTPAEGVLDYVIEDKEILLQVFMLFGRCGHS